MANPSITYADALKLIQQNGAIFSKEMLKGMSGSDRVRLLLSMGMKIPVDMVTLPKPKARVKKQTKVTRKPKAKKRSA